MLTELPTETILQIASSLCFNDKFQLMLTCHALHRIIVDKSLYEELSVMGGWIGPDISKVIQKFKSKKLNGSQVKTLEIDLNAVPDKLYGELPTIFPNVNTLISEQGNERKRAYTVVKFLKKWKDKIEAINMGAGYTNLIHILEKKNTTFTKLNRLRISPYIHTDFNMWKDDVNIINCLRNAPALEQLQLYDARVSIELLEAVHTNCPKLEILSIEDSIFLTTGEALPTPLTPATSLVCFAINGDSVIYDDKGVLLDYIISKYTNMETFGFFGRRNNRLVNHTINAMDAKPRAMWLHVDDDFPVIETKQSDLKRTNTYYRTHGSTKLFSRLPATVKFFSLETSMFKDIAASLDISDFQPKVLYLISLDKDGDKTNAEVFTNEQEVEFLRKQTRLDEMATEFSVQTFKTASLICSPLKKLTLSIKGDEEMELSWILDAFPSLEKLDIEQTSADLKITGGKEGKSYPKLHKLKMETDAPQPDVLAFLSAAAPNLKELSWTIGEKLDRNGKYVKAKKAKKTRGKSKAQLEKEQEEEQRLQEENEKYFRIDLTGLNLDVLRLYAKFRYNYDLYIYTEIKTKDNKTHTYIIQPHQYNLLADWYFKSLEEIEDKVKLEDMKRLIITCDSLKELRVDGLVGAIKF